MNCNNKTAPGPTWQNMNCNKKTAPGPTCQRLGYTPPSIKTVQFQIENGYIDSVAISERLIDGTSYDNSNFGPSHSGSFENLGDGNTYNGNHFTDDITQ